MSQTAIKKSIAFETLSSFIHTQVLPKTTKSRPVANFQFKLCTADASEILTLLQAILMLPQSEMNGSFNTSFSLKLYCISVADCGGC